MLLFHRSYPAGQRTDDALVHDVEIKILRNTLLRVKVIDSNGAEERFNGREVELQLFNRHKNMSCAIPVDRSPQYDNTCTTGHRNTTARASISYVDTLNGGLCAWGFSMRYSFAPENR